MRDRCLRCLRPTAFCCCRGLVPVATRTRVVILQHPREARLAICSAWLAHVGLSASEVHRGVRFDRDPRARARLAEPGTALLFPGPGATPIDGLASPPRALVVVDGTWPQALKMLRDDPLLAALPRVALSPARPGAYGELRREPGPEHLSTLEAIVAALAALEGSPERFQPLLAAFERSVELQLACARGPRRNPRHRGSGQG